MHIENWRNMPVARFELATYTFQLASSVIGTASSLTNMSVSLLTKLSYTGNGLSKQKLFYKDCVMIRQERELNCQKLKISDHAQNALRSDTANRWYSNSFLRRAPMPFRHPGAPLRDVLIFL